MPTCVIHETLLTSEYAPYAALVSGAAVFLDSSDEKGSAPGDVGSTIRDTALVTGGDGTVSFGYSRTGGSLREVLKATWDNFLPAIDLNRDGDTDDPGERAQRGTNGILNLVQSGTTQANGCDDRPNTIRQLGDVCGITTQDWVEAERNPSQTAPPLRILDINVENDQIVYDSTPDARNVVPKSINYDAGDFFSITSSATGTAVTRNTVVADFEAALVADLAAAAAAPGTQPTLTWSSYVFDDPSNITSFRVTLGTGR